MKWVLDRETVRFDFDDSRKKEISETTRLSCYRCIREKVIIQSITIVGYLLSGDPAYIPRYRGCPEL